MLDEEFFGAVAVGQSLQRFQSRAPVALNDRVQRGFMAEGSVAKPPAAFGLGGMSESRWL